MRTPLLLLALTAALATGQVRISQVYGGGGNTGATYKNDFIELYNAGTSAVNLSTWSVQYAASTGTSWQRTNLTGSIAPGGYYLIQQALGAGGTVNLPTPDATGSIAMSGTAGKVALVSNQTTYTAISCPTDAAVVDFVGFGSATNCSESAPTANLSNTTAAIRKAAGCTDTNINSADFDLLAPTPRNSASPTNTCGGGGGPVTPSLSINDVSIAEGNSGTTNATFTVLLSSTSASAVTFDIATADGTATVANADYAARSLTAQTIPSGLQTYQFTVTINGDTNVEPNETFFVNVTNVVGATVADAQGQGTIQNDDVAVTTISAIQGSGNASPLVGQTVSTQGVVTALTSNGYYLQTPDASADSDPNTSEGIFVFTNSAPTVAVGNAVISTGVVTEFTPSTDPNSRPITEITQASQVILSSGNPLPAAVTLTQPTANGGPDQLEKFEGMRVQVASLTATSPTDGNVAEATAQGSSNGVIYAVFPGVALPKREAGIEIFDLPANPATACAAGAGCSLPVFDGNPERIRLDTDAITGQVAVNVNTGATLSNITGVLHYNFRAYTILTTAPVTVSGTQVSLTGVPAPQANTVSIAAMNVERLFDDVDDPGVGDVVVQSTAFNGRLAKISLAIRNQLGTPDVVAFEEADNLNVLSSLATKINGDAVAAGQPSPGYTAQLSEGNDVGGIDVGFLMKSTVTVNSVTQIDKPLTYTSPCTGLQEILNDRPPLRLRGTAVKGGKTLDFTVIVNHLRSLNNVGDTTACASGTEGNRVRTKRAAQADHLTTVIEAELAANPNAKIVVVGDFNAFEVNDGYVDTINTIRGVPAPATQVLKSTRQATYAPMTNMLSLLPTAQQYSYVFDGNHQTLDHVILNPAAVSQFVGGGYARINSDFHEGLRGDFTRPERYSDHDPAIVHLTTATNITAQLGIVKTVVAFNRGTRLYSSTVQITNTTGATITGPLQMVVTGMTEQAQVTNANASTPSSFLYNVTAPLAPGQTVSVPVTFSLPASMPVTFNVAVFNGGL